jgi:hypothetical protein
MPWSPQGSEQPVERSGIADCLPRYESIIGEGGRDREETDVGEDDTGTERGQWTNLEDIGEGREDLGVIRDRGGLRRSNAMSRELINNSKSTRTAF